MNLDKNLNSCFQEKYQLLFALIGKECKLLEIFYQMLNFSRLDTTIIQFNSDHYRMIQEPTPPSIPTGIRALIADDHEDSARGLEMMLRTLGFETQIALDGIDALRRAKSFKPTLLLLDINMPKLDGFYTCGVIRVQPWAEQVRVVAVTGHHHDDLDMQSKRAGFDACLLKPVDFSVLRRVIGEMLFHFEGAK